MTRRLPILALLVCAAALLLAPAAAQARVYIDITQPFSRQLPLAMPKFEPLAGAAADQAGAKGHDSLRGNLEYTGLFELIDPKAYLEPAGQGDMVDYRRWSLVGAELLITGGYQAQGDNLTLELRLYDVVEKKLLVGRRYDGVRADLGAMTARFADEVMLAITGERSVFSTQIAFVGARQGEKGAVKEIYLMRWDGGGVRKLTHRGDISLYPAWSPDGELVAYSTYIKRRPAIMVHALAGGQGRVIINKPGVNLTPAFRPGTKELAVSMSHTGKTNIFLVDLAGQVLKRLTDGWGIEVAPSFSPDGRQMVFVSDRGGNPQLYILDLASGDTRRITFGFKYCAAPHWSPRGDRIAFQAEVDGTFQVATIRPDGSDLQILTSGWGGGEDPSWSPDGRLIAYSGRGTGSYQIYIITADGRPIKRLTNLPGNQTDPAWSPRGVAVK